MIFREQTEPERKLVTIKYYLTKEESAEFEKVAFFMHGQKVIPRPTLGAFAKAAAYKWYNEIRHIAMAKGKLSTTS